MRIKLLGFSLAACLVALAAWLVHRNNSSDTYFEDGLAPVTHGAEPQASEAEKIAEKVPEKHHATAYKGLEYLVKQQFPDGHWEGDGGRHPVAMTGLVGLALLMENDNPRHGRGKLDLDEAVSKAKYSANIRKAADWLMDKSQPKRDGLIFSEHASETARYMEGHGLATLFLAGVWRHEHDAARRKKLTEVLTRAVKYIAKAQASQGGWYHTSRVEGHDFAVISATAIQIQALQAAENARIGIPGGIIGDAKEYLKTALGEHEEAGPKQKSSRPADTAAALACGILFNYGQWLQYCEDEIAVGRNARLGRDELAHYYYAQTMFNFGGDAWGGYRTAMFDHLQSCQNKDGSWPAGNGIGVGPVYSTALWCIVLQLDNGSHPSRSQKYKIVD